MSRKIKDLKDKKSGVKFWPKTHQQAVVDDNGNKLDAVLAQKVDKVEGSSLVPDTKVEGYDSHVADKSNPHGVTKAQIGLGNVDNTSDADKPVSTAQKEALDNKVDKDATAATSGDYIYAQDANGNPIRIPKASLASLVADQIKAVAAEQAKVTFGATTMQELQTTVGQNLYGATTADALASVVAGKQFYQQKYCVNNQHNFEATSVNGYKVNITTANRFFILVFQQDNTASLSIYLFCRFHSIASFNLLCGTDNVNFQFLNNTLKFYSKTSFGGQMFVIGI